MGYQTEQINSYWATLNQYMDTIPKNYIRMWCADNNGQISKPLNTSSNYIGNWTLTNKTEKGNGGNLISTCNTHEYICPNAHKIPKTRTEPISPRGTALLKQRLGRLISS